MMPAGPPPAITQRVCSFSTMRFQSNSTETKNESKHAGECARSRCLYLQRGGRFLRRITTRLLGLFWTSNDRTGAISIGARVLDVCCGTGASALPAAEAVGPTGNVTGVDLAKELLELARHKAVQQRLGNIEFEVGDILSLRFPAKSFDAVVCVFGIFFVPDMARAVSELWSRIRPGGQLA